MHSALYNLFRNSFSFGFLTHKHKLKSTGLLSSSGGLGFLYQQKENKPMSTISPKQPSLALLNLTAHIVECHKKQLCISDYTCQKDPAETVGRGSLPRSTGRSQTWARRCIAVFPALTWVNYDMLNALT